MLLLVVFTFRILVVHASVYVQFCERLQNGGVREYISYKLQCSPHSELHWKHTRMDYCCRLQLVLMW